MDLEKKYHKKLKKIDETFKSDHEQIITDFTPAIEAQAQRDAATGLISKENAAKRLKYDIENSLKNHAFLSILLHGFDVIEHYEKELLTIDEQKHFKKDIKVCHERIQQLHESKEQEEPVAVDSIFQLYFKLSDSLMNAFHKIAYNLYQKGLLEDAKAVYILLTTLNPCVSDYYTALATINHKLGDEKEAVAFAFAAVAIDEGNPRNHILYANLLLDQGDFSQAKIEIADIEKLISKGSKQSHNKIDREDLEYLKARLAA